jgi:Hint module
MASLVLTKTLFCAMYLVTLATSSEVSTSQARTPGPRPNLSFDMKGVGDPGGYKLVSGQNSCPSALQISETWTVPIVPSPEPQSSLSALSHLIESLGSNRTIALNEEVAIQYKMWLLRHNKSHNHRQWEEATGNQILKKTDKNSLDYNRAKAFYGSGPMTEFGLPTGLDVANGITSCGFMSLYNISNAITAEINDRIGVLKSAVTGRAFFETSACLANAKEVQAPTVRSVTVVNTSLLYRTGVKLPLFKDLPDNNMDLTYLRSITTNATTKMLFFTTLVADSAFLRDCVYLDGNVAVDPTNNFTKLLFPNATIGMAPPPSMELMLKSLIRSERVDRPNKVQRPSSSDPYQSAPHAQGATFKDKSVPSEISNGTNSTIQAISSCFPDHSVIQLKDGRTKRMDEIEIGDSVLVGPRLYSDVFMFTHRQARVLSDFVVLETSSGHRLYISPGHYLYANDNLVASILVRPKDEVILGDGQRTSVITVSRTISTGLYNPQTIHGNIVVDGVLASTYTTAMSPKVAHASLAPLRIIYRILGAATSGFAHGAGFVDGMLPRGREDYQ